MKLFKLPLKTLVTLAVSVCLVSGCASVLKKLSESTNTDQSGDECQKHVEAEEWSAAIACYTDAVAKTPDDATAWGWRAYCYEAANNHHKAITDATKALSLDPAADWAFDTRASAYRALKMYKQAVNDYAGEIKLKPDEADNYVGRADCYDDMKDYKNALADYTKALQINSTSTIALNNRGWAYLELGQYQKALDDFDACLQEDDQYTNAYYNRAAANFRRGKYNEALADLKHVLENDPSEYLAYLTRGTIYLVKKEPGKALAEFNFASDRIADASGSLWGKISTYLTYKQLDRADDAKKLLKTMQDEATSNDWPYAIVQYLAGKMTDKQLLDFCTNDDERTEARGVIGTMQQLSADSTKAHEQFVWIKDHGTVNSRVLLLAIAALKDPSFLNAAKKSDQ